MTSVDDYANRNVEISTAVMAFGERFKGKPVEWGVDDCSMFAAQWAADRLGRSFDFPLYESEAEAHALIAEYGELVDVWRNVASMNGLRAVDAMRQAGDIGVINTFSVGQIGCVFLKYGAVAMLRTVEGVRLMPVRDRDIMGAWRVDDE
jgi:hypothetical protein